MKNKWRKITGIILTLLIVGGLVFAGIKYIPEIGNNVSNKRQENQENKVNLNVYELDYGENVYLITSAKYSMNCSYSNVTLTFYSKDINDDIGNIWFSVRDKPAKIKIIRTFKSRKDTTSFVKIK